MRNLEIWTLLKEYVADYPDDESAVKEAQFWETR